MTTQNGRVPQNGPALNHLQELLKDHPEILARDSHLPEGIEQLIPAEQRPQLTH